ncbi:MAG: hypothetical protein ABNH21_15980 [Glaciecola sp.]|jgi:hypothetical protein
MTERKIEIYSESIQGCINVLNGREVIDFNILELKLKPIKKVLRSIHPKSILKFHVNIESSESIMLVVSLIPSKDELAIWSNLTWREENIILIMKLSDRYHEIMSEGDNEKLQAFLIGLDSKCKQQIDALTTARSNKNFEGLNIPFGSNTIDVKKLPVTAREILMKWHS